MNLFDLALGGVNSMVDGRVQDLEEEERLAQQRALYESRYGSPGAPRAPGGAPAAPFDPATADRNVAYRLGLKSPEDLAAWQRGDDLMTKPRQVTPSAANDWKGGEVPSGKPPGFDELIADRLERLAQLRGGERFGKDYDDVTKGELTDAERNRLGRVEKGSRGATVAQLASKGQGEMDDLGGGVGIFSKVGGEQRLSEKGRADAQESRDKGRAAITRAEREPEDPEVENRRREAERRRQQAAAEQTERAVAKALKDHEESSKGKTPEEKAAWEKTRTDLRARLESARAAASGARPDAPAQSPKPAPAAQPPKSGQSKGGSTWTRND